MASRNCPCGAPVLKLTEALEQRARALHAKAVELGTRPVDSVYEGPKLCGACAWQALLRVDEDDEINSSGGRA
jgi:hypothetical protein